MGVIENIEKTIDLKNRIEGIERMCLRQNREFEEKQARELAEFNKAQKAAKKIFLNGQNEAKETFKKEIKTLQDSQETLKADNKRLLNRAFFIRFGDLKEELIKNTGKTEAALEATVFPEITLHECYSTKELTRMIMESKNSNVFVVTNLKVHGTDILFRFGSYVDFTMPQADGVPLIDHCYSTSDSEVEQATKHLSFLRIYPENINDYLVKVPYRLLFEEADFSTSKYYIEIGKEYYRNYPGELFRTCVKNCAKKGSLEVPAKGPKKVLAPNKE